MRLFITGASGFIGTNAVDIFSQPGNTILNYSLHPPLKAEHKEFWVAGDILDADATKAALQKFQPDRVLHLAARAECDENTTVEEGYRVNIDGTRNVLDAIRATPSVERVIITSSQFVCGPGPLPTSDTDYFPETVYGQSKVITEKLTREANLPVCWTIIRPTNIWGPWHMRYRREFWRVVERGLYVHPGREPVIRCYGYVKNIVHQMRKIFETPPDLVRGKTIYLGDRPMNLFEWTNGFSRQLTGRDVRVVPRSVMRALALLGDIPSRLTGKPFLINSSRLRSMTTDYTTPMEETFKLLGENPYSLEDGVRETVEWLRSHRDFNASLGGGF
ncbi:MAG: GlcNAc-P-P-Und epimerase [Verrucomicrobiota bacterium]|jgi:nucleoside-diphosphate-sugar epimerase